VTAKHADAIDTEVLNGGELSDRKGVNVPQAVLDLSRSPRKTAAT
jgi:pyruvate kinase